MICKTGRALSFFVLPINWTLFSALPLPIGKKQQNFWSLQEEMMHMFICIQSGVVRALSLGMWRCGDAC